MVPWQEIADSSRGPPADAKDYERSTQLQSAIDFPLGHEWGFETASGITRPPLYPIYKGKNRGLQFFPKPGIKDIPEKFWRPEYFWRPAGYPENFIDFCD